MVVSPVPHIVTLTPLATLMPLLETVTLSS